MSLTGTWKTKYGILKLAENQGFVSGVYRDLGVIEGQRKEDVIVGTFTNSGHIGRFVWKMTQKDSAFSGYWAWGQGAALELPDGQLQSDEYAWTGAKQRDEFEIVEGGAGPWQGVWGSTRGSLRLVQHDSRVLGLHDDVGVFEGQAKGGRLEGRFTTFGENANVVFEMSYDEAGAHGVFRYENGSGEDDVWRIMRMTDQHPSSDAQRPRGSKTGERC